MNWILNAFPPNEIATLLLIMAVAIAVTEGAKRLIRRHTEAKTNNTTPRILGFAVGYFLSITFWPETSELSSQLIGIFVGTTNPILYRIFKWRWPNIARALKRRDHE